MLVCERLGCPEGAAQFAQAAVHQVDAAYPGEGGNEAARQAREGRLWTNLFMYHIEAGRMEVRTCPSTPMGGPARREVPVACAPIWELTGCRSAAVCEPSRASALRVRHGAPQNTLALTLARG